MKPGMMKLLSLELGNKKNGQAINQDVQGIEKGD